MENLCHLMKTTKAVAERSQKALLSISLSTIGEIKKPLNIKLIALEPVSKMPISDALGRAFEYFVAESILSECKRLFPNKVSLTQRAKDMQQRDQKRLNSITHLQRTHFQTSGAKIARWLTENKLKKIEEMTFEKMKTLTNYLSRETAYEGVEKVEIDRIPDVAGVKGDVTDIRIKVFSKDRIATLNVSIKHRHEAFKHPRLTRVPEWIGLTGTKEGKEYLKAYEQIWEAFFQKSKMLLPIAQRFRELKAIDQDFIEVNLYRPLYKLVGNFIKNNAKRPNQVQQMFSFLVGTYDYIKFIDHDGKIEVRDFSRTTKPNSITVEYKEGGYIYFQFDNGWRLSGRLHTATEWLKKSIKFDIQPTNLDSVVPPTYI